MVIEVRFYEITTRIQIENWNDRRLAGFNRHSRFLDLFVALHCIVTDVKQTDFDAATAILVMHFLPEDEKTDFLQAIYQRLKPSGKFIIADGWFDKKSEDFEWLLKNYKRHTELKGVSPEITGQAVKTITENVFFISPEREVELLKEAGFTKIKSFFQGLWVRAWIAEKQ